MSAVQGPVLVVVAHPDDETLGCGATMAALADRSVDVSTCILCAGAGARRHRPEDDELRADTELAHSLLGARVAAWGAFPNIELNTVPHLELVQFIEAALAETGARTVFTHHPQDLNDDHLYTARACQAAARLFQRRAGVPPLEALYFMEVLSSTDWAFPGTAEPFRPDAFFEVGASGVARKLDALSAYRGVMRPYPHPRSAPAVEGLAALRGAQAGVDRAEAFQTVFHRLSP